MKTRIKNLFTLPALIAVLGLLLAGRVTAQPLTLTTLHGYTATSTNASGVFTNSDGTSPYAKLILSGNMLYGAAAGGGRSGNGAVFAVNINGAGFTNLYSFTATSTNASGVFTNSDGATSRAGLVLSGNTLYGVAVGGGTSGNGTIFKVNTDGTGFTNLYSFTARSGSSSTNSDGANPYAGLVLSGNTLYGTAVFGGFSGVGTIFKINTDGSGFTNLYTFTGVNHGSYPYGGLILSGSALYGTAYGGGTSGAGMVFAVNTNGTGFTNLYSFTGFGDGANPNAGLILSGSTLYGTAFSGGSGFGTVFAVNTNGTDFTNLYSFTGGNDGSGPYAELILSSNTLFGTTVLGGSSRAGTVFGVNTNGTGFTNLYSFTGGNDGGYPYAGLVSPGNILYGTASGGGAAANGTVFALGPPVTNADLSLSASAAPEPVGLGSNLVYTVSITNQGPSAATGVVVSNRVPASVTFVSATGGATPSGGILLVNIGALAAGAINSAQIVVQPTSSGKLTNLFQVFANETDPVLTNNSAILISTVTNNPPPPVTNADLSLSASAAPEPVTVGSNLVYTISITNGGPAAASGVVVSNRVPASVIFVSATGGATPSGGILLVNLGALAAGTTNSAQIVVQPAAASKLTNFFQVFASQNDPVLTNNSATVISTVTNGPSSYATNSDLSLSASAVPEPVAVGSNLVYTITITNGGPAAATGVVVSNRVPVNVTFVSATGGATPSGGSLLVNLGTLAAGATNSAQIVVQPVSAGKLTNFFQVFASQNDPVLTNNSATVISTVTNAPPPPVTNADLSLSASAVPEPVAVGSNLVYTITVTNGGPAAATGVVVSNRVPASVTFVSATGGSTPSGGVLLVNLGALAAGATNTAQVVVQPTSSGKLTNLFRVFANETDPVLTNNSATVVSTVTNVVTVVTGADVQVFLTGPASSPPGSNITYTITVSNAGPSTSSNIVVKDAFPSAFAFVSASAGGTNGGGTVTWPTFAALLSGGSTILTLTVAAISSGTVTNIAFASAATIDPNPTNNNASLPASQAVTIVAPLQFTITAGPGVTQIGFNTYRVNTNAFNPQTGLYEESVTVTNIGVTTVEGVRLFVGGLRSGVTLWNATGTNGGVPYVEYDAPLYPANTLPPSSVTFTLEFYGLHVPFTNALTAVALTNDVMPTNSLNPATIYATNWVTITTNFVDMRIPGNKRFVFEFRSIPGTTYTIIYATNLTQTYWFIAVPPVTANANITQWYDDGPPKTLSQPMSTSSPIRFYQVFKN